MILIYIILIIMLLNIYMCMYISLSNYYNVVSKNDYIN
jgi:hypothetical protein